MILQDNISQQRLQELQETDKILIKMIQTEIQINWLLVLTFVAVAVSLHQGAPGRVSLTGKSAHVQVADGQPDD